MSAFVINEPDYERSPTTGLVRRHWIDAAEHVLRLAFGHVADADQMIEFPPSPGRSYPQPGAPRWQHQSKTLEGLRRTMNVAAPLLSVRPDLAIDGIGVADYYARRLCELLGRDGPLSIPRLTDIGHGFYQFTCELGGLGQTLLTYPDLFWPRLSDDERDAVAETLSLWGHYRTQPHNWRFFNVMILTFLKKAGYPIDDELLTGHLDHLLALHGGGGWYDDGHFDYYTPWLFHESAIAWNVAYGNDHDPARAAVHAARFDAFMQSYPKLFARDGRMLMWGRSICYRMAAAAPFPLAFLDASRPPPIGGGQARRIASGMLRQFLTRDDLWHDGIPCLGFYRPWEPAVQPYSSTASPYWMFLPMLALKLPESSPFWTEVEDDGDWQEIGDGTRTLALPDAAMHLTHHGRGGDVELRPTHVTSPNIHYDRLSFHTAIPWEAEDPAGATAGCYAIRSRRPDHADARFVTHRQILGGVVRDGVLHRSLQLADTGHGRFSWIDLGDLPVDGGVLRIDRVRAAQEHDLRLGHYGLPHASKNDVIVRRRGERAITAHAVDRATALVAVHGWQTVDAVTRHDLNAEQPWSTVLFAARSDERLSPPMVVLVTLMLFRTDGGDWTDGELAQVAEVVTLPLSAEGHALATLVRLTGGESVTARFDPLAKFA